MAWGKCVMQLGTSVIWFLELLVNMGLHYPPLKWYLLEVNILDNGIIIHLYKPNNYK